MLDVNVETVQRAYRKLSDDGIVVSRGGRGTRVSETLDVTAIGLNGLIDELVDLARRLGSSLEALMRQRHRSELTDVAADDARSGLNPIQNAGQVLPVSRRQTVVLLSVSTETPRDRPRA